MNFIFIGHFASAVWSNITSFQPCDSLRHVHQHVAMDIMYVLPVTGIHLRDIKTHMYEQFLLRLLAGAHLTAQIVFANSNTFTAAVRRS